MRIDRGWGRAALQMAGPWLDVYDRKGLGILRWLYRERNLVLYTFCYFCARRGQRPRVGTAVRPTITQA